MNWAELLNYVLGIFFFIALFFAFRYEEKAHQAELRNDLLAREILMLNLRMKERDHR